MDGFSWFKSAAAQEPPGARAVMDPFHVVAPAVDRLDECRRRVQREITGRRGRKNNTLHRARRALLTGADLLTGAQAQRLENLFTDERPGPGHPGRPPALDPGPSRRSPSVRGPFW